MAGGGPVRRPAPRRMCSPRCTIRHSRPADSASATRSRRARVRRHGNAFPDRARPERPDDGRRAADVIGIAVRDDEGVEASDAERAQGRRHDALPDVEARRSRSGVSMGAGAGRPPASIRKARPIREPHQRRVALADIQKHDAERITWRFLDLSGVRRCRRATIPERGSGSRRA